MNHNTHDISTCGSTRRIIDPPTPGLKKKKRQQMQHISSDCDLVCVGGNAEHVLTQPPLRGVGGALRWRSPPPKAIGGSWRVVARE